MFSGENPGRRLFRKCCSGPTIHVVESRESRERKGKGREEEKQRRGEVFFFSSCGEWELCAESALWYRKIILFHRKKKKGHRREVIEKREDREEKIFFLGVSGFIGVDNGAWSTEQQ
jgi:hypothetical protein